MICAALCWHDEPPEMLHRCITSLAGVAEHVVAVEGRWPGFDQPLVYDPAEQWAAIHEAAARVGIVASISGIGLNWESQIQKRDALMRSAAHWGAWILVVDADDYVEHAAGELHDLLAAADLDVAEIHARYWIGRRETSRPVRRLFRAAAGVTVCGAHNGYRTADGRWLHAPRNVVTEPALDLTAELRLAHDSGPRTRTRQRAMARYYAFRAASNEETLRKEPLCASA